MNESTWLRVVPNKIFLDSIVAARKVVELRRHATIFAQGIPQTALSWALFFTSKSTNLPMGRCQREYAQMDVAQWVDFGDDKSESFPDGRLEQLRRG